MTELIMLVKGATEQEPVLQVPDPADSPPGRRCLCPPTIITKVHVICFKVMSSVCHEMFFTGATLEKTLFGKIFGIYEHLLKDKTRAASLKLYTDSKS